MLTSSKVHCSPAIPTAHLPIKTAFAWTPKVKKTSIKLQSSTRNSISKSLHEFQTGRDVPTSALARCLEAIQKWNLRCNAFLHVEDNTYLEHQAQFADQAYKRNQARPLEGIPLAVKDNLCTLRMPTTCASLVLQNYVSPFDATCITRLKELGAILVGKTNMDEFGMGSLNLNSAFGPTHQISGQLAGGSSGGSAVAVQTGMALAALGSDTGGSIRLPASYCGLYSLKPSYGVLSRHGLIPFAHTLDTIGFLAGSVDDLALLFSCFSTSPSPKDMTHTGGSPPTPMAPSATVGVPHANFAALSPSMRDVWSHVLSRYPSVVSIPWPTHALSVYHVLSSCEAASNLLKFDGIRFGQPLSYVGDPVKARILAGSHALSASLTPSYYTRATQLRFQLIQEFQQLFHDTMDIILVPCAFSHAPTTSPLSPSQGYVEDIFTILPSLLGLPVLTLPFYYQHQYYGIQCIGAFGKDWQVIQFAQEFVRSFPCPT